MMKQCRGVRGAITADANTRESILNATRELLLKMIEANEVDQEDVASVIFTTTVDLNAEFPALAARQIGWTDSALLCEHEMAVPGALSRVIRILIHWNTEKSGRDIKHIYLRDAVKLRPDRALSDLNRLLNGKDGPAETTTS
ncbi:MAG: chorismate mutase [Chloroflexi bacterium]|nr:chorismate mutase [Chloroflexota bacterium]